MNTRIALLLFSIFLLAQVNLAFGQKSYQFGALPSINLNKKFKNNWSVNSKLESRYLFKRGLIEGNVTQSNQYILSDLSFIAAKNVGLNSRIGGGYLLRFEDQSLTHRFIQQFSMVQKFSGFRLAHRFLSDQTFSPTEKPTFRLRYRATSEIPLNGQAVDAGEFYLKLNNEYVNSLQKNEYDLEIRLVPLIGLDISKEFKIETGLDYRMNSFIKGNRRDSYWMSINFFIEI